MEKLTESRLRAMAGLPLVESKQAVKESALSDEFGAIGTFIEQELDVYSNMMQDSEYNTSMDELDCETISQYLGDMVDDKLAEIFASARFKQLCLAVAGQRGQQLTDPEQRQLDV